MIRKVSTQGKMLPVKWLEILLSRIWENQFKELSQWEEKLSWELVSMDLLKLKEIKKNEEKLDLGEVIGESKLLILKLI